MAQVLEGENAIARWRREQSYQRTTERRADLLEGGDDATIIWIMEPVATDTSARESRAFI